MEESDEKKGFKVQDRRRFSSEGELKPEHSGPEQDLADSGGAPGVSAASPGASSGASARPSKPTETGEPEISFATFVVGLSGEALAALGEIPDPATGNPRRDLKAAQQLIDIIGMLREKTRGNLDRDEESLVDAILFDLRMKYVELVKPSAR